MQFLKKGDKVIIILVLILALGTYIAFALTVSQDAPQKVEIFVDNKLYAEYNLTEIKTEKMVKINSDYGNNTLIITPDGAEMIKASCPDKKDVRNGKITKPGQMIICAPNRVCVKLIGNTKTQVDKVSY